MLTTPLCRTTIESLAKMAKSLGQLGAMTGASDHGVLARWGAGASA